MTDEYFRKEVVDGPLYHVQHHEGIKLNQNESPWDIPLDLKVRITERLIKTDWNRYPVDDMIHLKKKMATLFGFHPDQLVLANGSNVIIQALINIIPTNHKVMVLDPTFVIYEMQAEMHGNKVIKVPLSEDFELQTERMLAEIKKHKPGMIFIANPNAPTGSLFDKRSLYRIIQSTSCPVVIDEAYYPFTEETVQEWLADFDNLVIMRTFSKAYALGGVRFGYIATHPDIACQVEKFLMTFRLSKLTCAIIDEILDDHSYMKQYVQDIVKERGRLFSKLQKIEQIRVYPSEANFLLIRVPNAPEISRKLIEQKVLIRNMHKPESALENCLRVAVGTVEENDQFLAALKVALNA